MGVVYEAEQVSMGRRVALKILPMAGALQQKQLLRFRNEVRAAAMLDHPHIVSVYSIGEERGVHFYAMQLIRGQSLAEVIQDLQRDRADERTTERRTDRRVDSSGDLFVRRAAGRCQWNCPMPMRRQKIRRSLAR